MSRLDLDLEFERGTFSLAVRESLDLSGITAIVGANGSGKTSLLRVIAGLEPGASGTIRFRGREWLGVGGSTRPEAREIGYVFQDGRLFPHLDVRRNLEFASTHGRRTPPIRFADVVGILALERLLERYPADLSGGERQRVAIGRALLAAPGLLLMDEPLSALDLVRKRELLPLIKSLPTRFELPLIYVTHDLDELVYLADTVVLLADGRNIARGTAQQILSRSDFEHLTRLEQPGTVLAGLIAKHDGDLTLVSLTNGELRIPRVAGESGERIQLRIQPRDVILATDVPSGISIRNRLSAVVTRLEEVDGQVLVGLDLGGQSLSARITGDAAHELALTCGMRIYALIKTVAVDTFSRLRSDPQQDRQAPKP